MPRPRRLAATTLITLAGLLGLWISASSVAEAWTLHPVHRGIGPAPAVPYRDVSFNNSAGMTLRGWWIPGTRHQTVVMIHGWTSSRAEPMGKAGYLLAAGYNLLVFDLRGHGRSDGNYTTMGYAEPDDVSSAIAFARGLDPGAPIALLGYSLGAALAVETGARDERVAAVVEDSGFASLSEVFMADFRHLFLVPAQPFGMVYVAIAESDLQMDIDAVRPVADAARLDKPLLAILGTADTTVPPAEGYEIYAAAPGPKQILVVPGAGHVAAYDRDRARYEQTVLSFLEASLPPPS